MSLTLTAVPDCQARLGPSQSEVTFQVAPALSDYPIGGYPITAAELGTDKLYGAWAINANAAAAAYGVSFVQSPAPSTPQAAGTLLMFISSGGSQLSANTNLQGCSWTVRFLSQGE